jgi:hypothetical protein
LLFTIAAIAVASPMYVKNLLLFGNPLFPFPTGFSNRDLSPEFVHAWTTSNTWDKHLLPLGWKLWLWPYFWVTKDFYDPLSPGPAFLIGGLMVLYRWRDWRARVWPMLLITLVSVPLWFFVMPLTRFTWHWLVLLMIFACGPLSERPRRWSAMIPVLICAVIAPLTILCELGRTIQTGRNLLGLETDHAYLSRVVPMDVGPDYAPPLDGTWALNERTQPRSSDRRVLYDSNLIAFADFPTINAPDYLQVAALTDRVWESHDGLSLCQSSTRIGDAELLDELWNRLQIDHILVRKGRNCPDNAATARDGQADRRESSVKGENRFNVIMDHWTTRGLLTRTDYPDSILYTFVPEAVRNQLDGIEPTRRPHHRMTDSED